LYLDPAILVKLLVREADSAHYARIVDGQIAWSSQLLLTECYSALLRKEREGALATKHRKRAWRQVERDVAQRRLSLVALSPELLTTANAIMESCHPSIVLRSLDAIHLASARQCGSWPLCINEDRMRRAAERLALPLCPLPGAEGSSSKP
jgi:predicted nucleic acid-binding protein